MSVVYNEPMVNITDTELAWLAGILEGEGSFMMSRNVVNGKVYFYPRIVVGMTDKDIIDRVSKLFGTSTYKIPVVNGRKQAWRAQVSGAKSVQIMESLLIYMGDRRSNKINEILDLYRQTATSSNRRSKHNHSSAKVRWGVYGTRNGSLKDAVVNCSSCQKDFPYPAQIDIDKLPWRNALEECMATEAEIECFDCFSAHRI